MGSAETSEWHPRLDHTTSGYLKATHVVAEMSFLLLNSTLLSCPFLSRLLQSHYSIGRV